MITRWALTVKLVTEIRLPLVVQTLQIHGLYWIRKHFKSVNLQYITLGCLDDGTNESSTKSLMLKVLFFYIFCRLRALKTLYFYFCNLVKK